MIELRSVVTVLSAQTDLLRLSKDSRLTSAMIDQIQILGYELASLSFCIFCLKKLNESSFGKNKDSRLAGVSRIQAPLLLLETGFLALESGQFEDWDFLSSELLESIQIRKLAIKEDCFNLLDCLSQCDFSRNQVETRMSSTTAYMANVLRLKGEMILDQKVKFESLKENLELSKEVFRFTANQFNTDEEIEEIDNCDIDEDSAQGLENCDGNEEWASNIACLCLLNWVLDEKEENMAPIANVILSDLLQKLNTALPEVTEMCLAALKTSIPSEYSGVKVGALVSKLVDFLFGKLQVDLPKDDIQMLRNGMILLLTFLKDPPEAEEYANDGKLILTKTAAAAVNDAAACLITSLSAGETKEGIAEKRNFLLHDFLGKFNLIEEEVRKICAPLFLDSSSFNFPRINVLALFDSLVKRLRQIPIRYSVYQIVKVHEELMSLRDLLKASNLKEDFMSKLQNRDNELKDLSTRIIEVAYKAERTISSIMYMTSFVWHDLLCLSDATEEIKHIVAEVKRIKDHHMHEIDATITRKNSSAGVLLQTNVQIMDEMVVGFEAEVKEILDWLRSGPRELDIISIIGMAGMGKTTLAKKVYGDPSVKSHFTKCAWCTVSQSYNIKRLLLGILHDVTVVDDSFFGKEETDLADMLRKCLKGQKYLIVMDDIWDVSAWNELKLSFPDDNKGSRIIFTSRIHNVVLEAKSDSCPYPLRPLSEEESWKLLAKRVFHTDSCPFNFAGVGKQIAKDCKGLPLAIVLVAGLLKEKVENLDWWKQIGENLGSRISQEGCVNILEQSYRHLPEPLKPCFLYFGSFREDKVIRVQKLIQLWVLEGFVQEQDTNNLEIVAEQYLMDLVGRSLVMVTSRSSRGGIKACRVHDLLWEFCLAKAEEENFLKVVRGNDNSQISSKTLDKHYRVCIQSKDWSSFLFWNSSALHSLLFSPTATYRPLDMYYWSSSNPRFLQILDLEDVKLLGDFPENITKLHLLTYIGINCTARYIPPEISKLQNLQVLRVRRVPANIDFPDTLWRMEKLRHVVVGLCSPPYLHDYVSPLENIQSFSALFFNDGGKMLRFLRKIPRVQKLRCEYSPTWKYNEKLELDFLNHLESLNVSCRLRNLASFPFSLPSNLKKLTLKYFCLPWTKISTIAKLPNLEVLKLLSIAFFGRTWNVEDEEFLKLKFLKLQLLDIQEWKASDESFPCLEQLVVDTCGKLEEIPSAFVNIRTLKMILVERCSSKVARSAEQIQEEQIDLGNEDLKVLIGSSFGK